MDKNRPPNVMRPGYRDLGKGKTHKHIVSHVDLDAFVQEQLGPDITERDLIELAVATLRRINLHLSIITDEEIDYGDIIWPT
ncbi:hypothetical protein LCGC14_0430790 [marine sediment metagenome]|uniref:Uncharacterized protein n=1 Tax=marine sediment metagenome TaxID=412755 RepID=A0A0F9SU72_9ZZZZ